MHRLEIAPQKLYEGCLLAAIAHAVTVGETPDLNYEHSWDGINYSMNNSEGCRGTISFHQKYIVAAFRYEAAVDLSKEALSYFEGAPEEVIELAKAETLQYLLDDVNGQTKPLITAAFWGTPEALFSNQSMHELLKNCDSIIENQIMDFSDAMEQWEDYHEFHDGQAQLIEELFTIRKSVALDTEIQLDSSEMDALCGDTDECAESLRELNIIIV